MCIIYVYAIVCVYARETRAFVCAQLTARHARVCMRLVACVTALHSRMCLENSAIMLDLFGKIGNIYFANTGRILPVVFFMTLLSTYIYNLCMCYILYTYLYIIYYFHII